MDEDQVELNVEHGEGKLPDVLEGVKEKASDLKEKTDETFRDAKEKLKEASDEREADRLSEDDAARREAGTRPGRGVSVITS
jgi:hypothetical protein